ncbi:uncharacterized protein [Aegilops tauschii subsp. strangulata]|uniref:Uncharacterized protein n=2 Tax=Aegilops tauschii TaxID=37682 RepID=A0A453PF03_AEGTS|nr:uncharacterized protein LOC109779030 [Aegilops tauschii subsp. strangulata]
MSTPPSEEGGGGSLPLPADCEGLISEKTWALLGEERRRMIMDTLHRTEADNVEAPRGRFDEFHFSPVSPGLGFKAMMPSDGYWEAVRRLKEEDARRQEEEDDRREKREELARQQREELVRQQMEEHARQKSEAMLLQTKPVDDPSH